MIQKTKNQQSMLLIKLSLKKSRSPSRTNILEAKIDQLVNYLYDLMDEEIKIVEESAG